MRAVTVWMITGLGALALLAAADEKDQEKIDLLKKMSGCCKTSNRVLSGLEYGGTVCGGKFLFDKLTTRFSKKKDDKAAPDLRDDCLMECMFDHNGLLSSDKTIKQETFREAITKKAEANGVHGDARADVVSAYFWCWHLIGPNEDEMKRAREEAAKRGGKRTCNRALKMVMSCITGFLLLNCAKSEWNESEQECAGKRKTIKQEVRNLEKKQPAESHKEVSEKLPEAAELTKNVNLENRQAAELQKNDNSENQQAAADLQNNESSENKQDAERRQMDHSLEMSAEQYAASDLVQPENPRLRDEQQQEQ